MKEFKMYTDLCFADSFADFVETEKIGANDFVLTNEFLYEKYIKPLALPCGVIFLEKYALGEPTTTMVDEIRAELYESGYASRMKQYQKKKILRQER